MDSPSSDSINNNTVFDKDRMVVGRSNGRVKKGKLKQTKNPPKKKRAKKKKVCEVASFTSP